MEKRIKNKVYDTEVSEKLASAHSDLPADSPYYWEEALYQKLRGEYFLYGRGGDMSRYAENLGDNNWAFGEEIIPLTYDAARKWADGKIPAEEAEAIFGNFIPKDDSTQLMTFRLPAAVYKQLRLYSSKHAVTMTDVLTKALNDFFASTETIE